MAFLANISFRRAIVLLIIVVSILTAGTGMTVKLTTPKPKVVYATLRCTEVPQEAQIVIQNEKGEWIANTSMAIKDKAWSAWLAEEYVGKSYFLVTTKAGDTYHVPLR